MPVLKILHSHLFILFIILIGAGCSKKERVTGLPAINTANDKAVGSSARDLLSAGSYTSVTIEINYMPGYQPDAGAVNNLTSFLSSLINKPGGINVISKQIASAGNATLSLSNVAYIEKDNRTAYTSGDHLGVYVLLTDGGYSEQGVLGIAFRNTSVCLFGKTIHDNSGGIGQTSRTKLESTVIEHEFGHLLGLVDIGSPMQSNHKDASHGNHCSNSNCLMYYASETTDILGFLLTGNIPPLDANCKSDLTANGGK